MMVHYFLSFHFEGIEDSEIEEITLSLLAGLIKGSVTSKFNFYLPHSVGFVSHLSSDIISSIMEKINMEVFPEGRTLRYILAEINEHNLYGNINEAEKAKFDLEMSKR